MLQRGNVAGDAPFSCCREFMMQTKFVIFAGIFGVITGLSFSTNQNILLSIGTALVAATFGLVAYFSKDKKDKQIEEIHKATTTKVQKEVMSQEEQNKIIALIREICHSKYNLRNREIGIKFQSILSDYSSRGFDLLPGSANSDITDLYVIEISAFSDILSETMVELLNSVKFKIDPKPFIDLSNEMISQKFSELEKLHCNFVNHYFQTVPENISTAMKESFKKQAEYELSLNISKISSQIELKNMA
jgi:hypothetical protein